MGSSRQKILKLYRADIAARQRLMSSSAPGQGQCAVAGRELKQELSGFTETNPITQYAPNKDIVINGTSPGHFLHDGYVVRWLSVDDAGTVQIWVYGRGVNTNFLTDAANTYGGAALFEAIDLQNSGVADMKIKGYADGP